MMKILLAAAAAGALALGACTQGPNEEAGENADSAYEQNTSGETQMGQGPLEEAGEAADEAVESTAPPPQ